MYMEVSLKERPIELKSPEIAGPDLVADEEVLEFSPGPVTLSLADAENIVSEIKVEENDFYDQVDVYESLNDEERDQTVEPVDPIELDRFVLKAVLSASAYNLRRELSNNGSPNKKRQITLKEKYKLALYNHYGITAAKSERKGETDKAKTNTQKAAELLLAQPTK